MKIIAGVTTFHLLCGFLVLSGALDFLGDDAHLDRGAALASVFFYWVVTIFSIVVIVYGRRQPRRLALCFGALIFSLGLAEGLIRITTPEKSLPRYVGIPSKAYHHSHPPNHEMFFGLVDGHIVTVRTNEDGLRTQYSREEFGLYRHRIAILGDSFAFGWRVPEESSLPVRLEAVLRDELNDSVAVLNAGVLSYSPLLSRLLFAGVVEKYDPTLVILLLDPTDIGDDYQYMQEATFRGDELVFDVEERRAPRSYGAIHELLRPCLDVLWENLAYPFASRQRYPYYAFELEIGDTIERNRFFIYRHPLTLTRPYFSSTLDNIDRLAERVASKGATFVLVISPRFHHWNRAEAPNNWERMSYELDEPYQFEYFRFFNEAREMRDYRILDLLPAFQATDEAPLVFDSDPHWNEHGHEFVARTLARYLLSERALDR